MVNNFTWHSVFKCSGCWLRTCSRCPKNSLGHIVWKLDVQWVVCRWLANVARAWCSTVAGWGPWLVEMAQWPPCTVHLAHIHSELPKRRLPLSIDWPFLFRNWLCAFRPFTITCRKLKGHFPTRNHPSSNNTTEQRTYKSVGCKLPHSIFALHSLPQTPNWRTRLPNQTPTQCRLLNSTTGSHGRKGGGPACFGRKPN